MIRLSVFAIVLMASSPLMARESLKSRVETNLRAGDARSIFLTEFWIPFHESANGESVFYGDFRLMGDNNENREGNFGLGYREIAQLPVLGRGVAGASAWIDRRKTQRNSTFYQAVLGGEWLAESLDIRMNGYVPLSNSREFSTSSSPTTASLIGTGVFVNTSGLSVEEPQYGVDFEMGYEIGAVLPAVREHTDTVRVFGGGYFFDGERTDEIAGYQMRVAADISQNIQFGARFQRDDVRGSQGFLEATLRFPFNTKQSFREQGLRARLDESPERDIDIVTGEREISGGQQEQEQVLNTATGLAQEVIYVDNQADVGGDGSIENPFNTLNDAELAANPHSVIYVNAGDGLSTNQNAGITLSQQGQQLIGSGENFVFDSTKFSLPSGVVPNNLVIREATTPPVISHAAGDGIIVTADDVVISGVTVHNASLDGIDVLDADNLTIRNTTLSDNGNRGLLYRVNNAVDGYTLTIDNVTASNNSSEGVRIQTNADAQLYLTNNTTISNDANAGMFVFSQGDAVVNATISNHTSTNDRKRGVRLLGDGTSQLNATINGLTATGITTEEGRGLQTQAVNNSTLNVAVLNSHFEGNNVGIVTFGLDTGTVGIQVTDTVINANAKTGVSHSATTNGVINSRIQGTRITNNAGNGVVYSDNSGGAITADLGGGALGSVGQNQIFNNSTFDLRVDLDGGTVSAENNWWGTPAGLQASDRDLPDGAVDFTPFLTSAP